MNQKQNKNLLLSVITLIFASIGGSSIAKETIKIGFYELPPYMSASLEKQGVIGLLLEKALKDKGEIQSFPVIPVRVTYLLDNAEITAGVTTVDTLCNNSTEYTCSNVIKLIPIVLAYRPENIEFNNIQAVDELKQYSNSIGQPKEYVLIDKGNNPLKFKEIKNASSGFKLLETRRLQGVLISEDVFDYDKVHNLIDQTMKKSKQLLQVPIHIIVKNKAESQWIIQSVNEYMKNNSYDSLWLDYYLNYAKVR